MNHLESGTREGRIITQLCDRMQCYHPRKLPIPLLPEAAVLMPVTRAPEPELILTVRTQSMPTHKGEVAFPGGRHEKGENIRETALREAREEVGILPQRVELLGHLTPLASKHGIKVTPFVGLVDRDIPLVGDPREIDEIFRVPLSFFLEQKPDLTQPFSFMGMQWRMPSYMYGNKRIWGLTAFMIIDLVNHVFDADINLN